MVYLNASYTYFENGNKSSRIHTNKKKCITEMISEHYMFTYLGGWVWIRERLSCQDGSLKRQSQTNR